MRIFVDDYEIEMTMDEFREYTELTKLKEPKDMTMDDELKFLKSLRHFELYEVYINDGRVILGLRSDKL